MVKTRGGRAASPPPAPPPSSKLIAKTKLERKADKGASAIEGAELRGHSDESRRGQHPDSSTPASHAKAAKPKTKSGTTSGAGPSSDNRETRSKSAAAAKPAEQKTPPVEKAATKSAPPSSNANGAKVSGRPKRAIPIASPRTKPKQARRVDTETESESVEDDATESDTSSGAGGLVSRAMVKPPGRPPKQLSDVAGPSSVKRSDAAASPLPGRETLGVKGDAGAGPSGVAMRPAVPHARRAPASLQNLAQPHPAASPAPACAPVDAQLQLNGMKIDDDILAAARDANDNPYGNVDGIPLYLWKDLYVDKDQHALQGKPETIFIRFEKFPRAWSETDVGEKLAGMKDDYNEYKFPMTTPIAVLRRELCRDFLNVFWPEMIVLQEEDTAVRLEDTLGGKPATLADFDLSPDHYILMEIILFRRNKELEYVASGKYEEARAEEAGRSAKRGWPAGAWPGMAQAEADEAPPPKRGRPTAASPAAPVRSDGAGPSRGNGRPARLLHGTRVMPGAVVDPANDRILPEPAPGGTAHLGHGRKKNFWTLEETDALLDGMYVHARSWKKIFTEYSEYMPGRRYQDYKDRWENLEKAYLNGFSDERRPLSQRIKRKIKSLITGGGDWPQPEECFEDEIEEDSD